MPQQHAQAEVDGSNGRVLDKFYITGVRPHNTSAPISPGCGPLGCMHGTWVVQGMRHASRRAAARSPTPRTWTSCAACLRTWSAPPRGVPCHAWAPSSAPLLASPSRPTRRRPCSTTSKASRVNLPCIWNPGTAWTSWAPLSGLGGRDHFMQPAAAPFAALEHAERPPAELRMPGVVATRRRWLRKAHEKPGFGLCADTYITNDVLSIEESIVNHVEYTLARSRNR